MEIMKYYAGIGSRETPKEILDVFTKLGKFLASKKYTLRSGHADGADMAFENGCDLVNGDKEIFLPWNNFNNSNSKLVLNSKDAYDIASQYHPYWHNLKEGARKLQARNSHQVLGWDLNTPSDFIICWTKNGKGVGGTGQAIRIAKAHNISVFDAGSYKDLDDVILNLTTYLLNQMEWN